MKKGENVKCTRDRLKISMKYFAYIYVLLFYTAQYILYIWIALIERFQKNRHGPVHRMDQKRDLVK